MSKADGDRPLAVVLPEVGLASETFLRRDVNELLPGGTVVVVDPPPGGASLRLPPAWQPEPPTLTFEPLSGDPPPPTSRITDVKRFLARHGVRVVLVEYLDFADRWFEHLAGLDVAVWLRGHGIDLSARLRDPGLRRRYARYKSAAGVIVPSLTAATRLRGLGLPADRAHYLPYGVDVPVRPPERPSRDVVRCVAVGRLVPKKAPLLTLEAFRHAYVADPRLRLDMVGDGPLVVELRDHVKRHGLESVVRLHGTLPHERVLTLMADSELLLHHAVTSPTDGDAEGLPVVVLEAMAAGLPVVATRHEGIPEAVEHGATGLLVEEWDVPAMAAAVLCLAGAAGERVAMSHRAWQVAANRYAYPDHRARLLKLLGLAGHA